MYPAGRSGQNEPENMFFGQELREIWLFKIILQLNTKNNNIARGPDVQLDIFEN